MRAADIIEGLRILTRYQPEAEADAQHDVLYAGSTPPSALHIDDHATLEKAGWSWDTKEDHWYCFT